MVLALNGVMLSTVAVYAFANAVGLLLERRPAAARVRLGDRLCAVTLLVCAACSSTSAGPIAG